MILYKKFAIYQVLIFEKRIYSGVTSGANTRREHIALPIVRGLRRENSYSGMANSHCQRAKLNSIMMVFGSAGVYIYICMRSKRTMDRAATIISREYRRRGETARRCEGIDSETSSS